MGILVPYGVTFDSVGGLSTFIQILFNILWSRGHDGLYYLQKHDAGKLDGWIPRPAEPEGHGLQPKNIEGEQKLSTLGQMSK